MALGQALQSSRPVSGRHTCLLWQRSAWRHAQAPKLRVQHLRTKTASRRCDQVRHCSLCVIILHGGPHWSDCAWMLCRYTATLFEEESATVMPISWLQGKFCCPTTCPYLCTCVLVISGRDFCWWQAALPWEMQCAVLGPCTFALSVVQNQVLACRVCACVLAGYVSATMCNSCPRGQAVAVHSLIQSVSSALHCHAALMNQIVQAAQNNFKFVMWHEHIVASTCTFASKEADTVYMVADLLILNQDPLADISVLERHEEFSAVMHNGAFVRRNHRRFVDHGVAPCK